MASFNRVILVGNLTRDPELRYTPTNTPVTEIGLAVNDRRKNANGEWIEETTFVDVTLWARTAEVASEYLTKGSPVLIEGRLKLDTWETDGQKRSKLRVVGERMQMLGGRGSGEGGGGGGRRGGTSAGRSGGGGGGGPQYDESEYGPPADVYGGSEGRGGGGSKQNDDIPF
ncbi:MAG TPA: single-stranded DNA-binding protein [Pirellulales bacterium]|nr:single-stranded DNA-binding protein [Pirellulales bacterium]